MQLQYLHGNPRPKHAVRAARKLKKSSHKAKTSSNPIIISANPLSKKEVAALRRELYSLSKSKKTPLKKKAKTHKKTAKKTVKKPSLTAEAIEKIVTKAISKQGEGKMAEKKKAHKKAKKVAKKHSKKVAKKHVKKAHKVAKKARKVAKKVTRKVAKKHTKKVVRKAARKTRKAAKRTRKLYKAVGGTIRRRGKHFKRRSTGHDTVIGRHTKVSGNARNLRRGEVLTEVVAYAPRQRMTKKGLKVGKTKLVRVTAKALNPRKKRKMKKHHMKRNPLIVSNPRRRHHKRRNPLVVSNPRFMSNPMGSIGASIVNMENKLIGAGFFKSIDSGAKKFLNAGVLEIAGLVVGAGFDGKIIQGFDWLSAKVPMVGEQLAKIPARYKAPVLVASTGLAIHLLNSFIEKKSNRKSQVLDELSKGLLGASLIKLVSALSPYSVESTHSSPVSGTIYRPALSGRGMGGYVMSNPSASMPTGHSDFSGADFEGADYGTNAIGGADFEGLVQTMGDSMIDNAVDADDMFTCEEDYGSDVASVSGIDF